MLNTKLNNMNKSKLTLASFFAGIGGIDLGFKDFAIIKYANEWDKFAQITYKLNFPDTILDKNDIKKLNINDIPNTDIIVGGFPCQAFSIAGNRKGFEDKKNGGDLFFEIKKIIEIKKPKAFLLENVKNLLSHNKGETFKLIIDSLKKIGYNVFWKVLNTKEYANIPQNRERVFIVGFLDRDKSTNFKFPNKINLTKSAKEFINYNDNNQQYFYNKLNFKQFDLLRKNVVSLDSIYQWRRRYVRENKNFICPTLTANMGTGGHNVPIILTKKGIRKLTPRECFNLQGFPKEYKLPNIANSHLYKQAGNSVTVSLIKRIAKNIIDVFKSEK